MLRKTRQHWIDQNRVNSTKPFSDLAQAIITMIANPASHDFEALALEVFAFQYKFNQPYGAFCRSRGVTPNEVHSWEDVPFIGISAFKQCDLTCFSKEDRTRYFLSSGTSEHGQSRHHHNDLSLAVYNHSASAWFQQEFLGRNLLDRTIGEFEVCSLTPTIAEAPHSSLVQMLHGIQPDPSRFFGGTDCDSQWILDVGRLKSFLSNRNENPAPIVLVGTAFNFVHLLDHPTSTPLPLTPNSLILETGGYKGRSRELVKSDLVSQLADLFQISQTRIRTEYGMCELGSQGYDHADRPGVFAFPPWTRVRIVSPEHGKPVPDGTPGLIQVFDLANIGSVCAVQTSDIGTMRDGRVEWMGRDPATSPRGCSLFAA